jgi:flavin-dependent dehydrogenase
MTADLVVVGASFAGLACARAAARAGLRVTLLEKKARAGDKLHTTGLIVKDAVDTVPWLGEVPPALVRRIEGVRLYAPNLRHVDLFAPGYYFWATDAPRLLDWMADSVRQDGVDVRLGELFTTARREGPGWHVPLADGGTVQARYLVGADGPQSRVARALGLSSNEQFLFGLEHEYAGARMEANLLHCFIDRELAPGYIGWAFSGVGVAQVGLARRIGAARPRAGAQARPASRESAPSGRPGSPPAGADMQRLLAKIAGSVEPSGAPTAVRAGMIPCGGLLPRVACPGALLVGDAAGMVSPVTAGGIHTALHHGAQAGAAIAAHLQGRAGDPSEWLVRTYPRFRSKRALRWLFDRFQSDWVFNRLLGTAPMRRAAELVYFHRKGGLPTPPAESP